MGLSKGTGERTLVLLKLRGYLFRGAEPRLSSFRASKLEQDSDGANLVPELEPLRAGWGSQRAHWGSHDLAADPD